MKKKKDQVPFGEKLDRQNEYRPKTSTWLIANSRQEQLYAGFAARSIAVHGDRFQPVVFPIISKGAVSPAPLTPNSGTCPFYTERNVDQSGQNWRKGFPNDPLPL